MFQNISSYCYVVMAVITLCACAEELQPSNEVVSRDSPRGFMNEEKWGPGARMLATIAKEIIARSTGNSQILSLNLTNLMILLLLKALVFAAGMLGAGNWQQHYARNYQPRAIEDSMLTTGEVSLFLSFLESQHSGRPDCIMQAACRQPAEAAEYLRTAKFVIDGAKIAQSVVSYNPRYEMLARQMDNAIKSGQSGVPCDKIYKCYL